MPVSLSLSHARAPFGTHGTTFGCAPQATTSSIHLVRGVLHPAQRQRRAYDPAVGTHLMGFHLGFHLGGESWREAIKRCEQGS